MKKMQNNISTELTEARKKSMVIHTRRNNSLWKEYLESSGQYTLSFPDWKKQRRKKKYE